MRRWPVEWMSSEAARQHASIKPSRLAGIETSSKRTLPAVSFGVVRDFCGQHVQQRLWRTPHSDRTIPGGMNLKPSALRIVFMSSGVGGESGVSGVS